MSGADGLGPLPAVATQISARSIENSLRELFASDSPDLLCTVIVGAAGNGVRTLIRERVPHLVDRAVTIAGHWPEAGADAEYLLCPDASSVPPDPPPSRLAAARVVIGCRSVDDLPGWVSALASKRCEFLTLGELTQEELGNLLPALLGGPVSASAFSELGSSAGFVPGHLTVIVRVLTREGVLAEIDGVWTLTAPIPAELFTQHLRNALAGFDAATRDLFLRLCFLGVAQPGTFSTQDSERIGVLEQAGLVRWSPERHYAVPSRTLAEAGQLLLNPVAAAEHVRAALASPSPPEFSVLWALRNDQEVERQAVEKVIRAALNRHDWSAANVIGALALERFSGHGDELFLCQVLIHQAVALRFLDEAEEALACLAHAESMLVDPEGAAATPEAEQPLIDELRARIATHRADIQHFKLGRLDAALDGLGRAEQQVRDAVLRTMLRGEQVLHLTYGGRFREATAAKESLRPRLHGGHSRTRMRLAIAHCLQLVAEGDIQRGFNVALRIGARQLLPPLREAWLVEEFSAAYFVSAFRLHPLAKLRTLMRRFEGQSAHTFRPDDTTYQLARASWLLAAGKVADAAQQISVCYANMQFHDPSGLAQTVVALRAQTAALCGERDTAREMMKAITRFAPRSSAVIDGSRAAHLSAAEYLLGVPDATERTLARAEAFIAEGTFGFAAEVLHSGVRFGAASPARRLIEIRDRITSPLVSLHVDHALAVTADDPIALVEIADRYQRAGLLLHSVEAYGLAREHAVIPEIVERRAEHEQRRLLSVVGEIRHPLIRRVDDSPAARLTRRELEVQELIVRGLSNREIAQRLSLSTRTVEGHISRLYQKTGRARRDPKRRA